MSRGKKKYLENYQIKFLQEKAEPTEENTFYLDLSAFVSSPRKPSPRNLSPSGNQKQLYLNTPNLKRKAPANDEEVTSATASDCTGVSGQNDPDSMTFERIESSAKKEDSNESWDNQASSKITDESSNFFDLAYMKVGRQLRSKGRFWVNFEDMDREDQSAREESLLSKVPPWARKKCHLDSKGIPVGAPGHDPKTLFIPPEELSKLTPMMKQYWRIKKDMNFDKIVLFKKGNFYQALYEDAIDCYKILNYALKNSHLLVGIPEQNIDWAVEKLITADFEVAIVDEIENYKESKERTVQMRKENIKIKKEDQLMQREVVEIKSKGVAINPTSQEEKYLLSIVICSSNPGLKAVAALELHQRKLFLGVVGIACPDGKELIDGELNSILYQTRPPEILISSESAEILKKLRQICPFSKITQKKANSKFWDSNESVLIIEQEFGPLANCTTRLLVELNSEEQIKPLAFSALAGILNHLKDHLILEKYLKLLKFLPLSDLIMPLRNKKLYLDSHTLMNLDISSHNKEKKRFQEGTSLLDLLDQTGTNSGKRMIKKWVENPLFDLGAIEARLDALEALESRKADRDNFRIQIKLLGDLEYTTNKLAVYSLNREVDRVNINFYLEDRSTVRLRELKELLIKYQEAFQLILSCFAYCKSSSTRLMALVTLEGKTCSSGLPGLLPNVEEKIKVFKEIIVWHDNIPVPKKGFSNEYDATTDRIKVLQGQLNDYLEELRVDFKDQTIAFVKIKKRYEIEISDETLKQNQSKVENWEPISMKSGFKRFHSPFVRGLVDEIEELEVNLKYHLSDFALKVFSLFQAETDYWDRFNSVLSELDCLCTLSHFSFSAPGFSRPILLPPSEQPNYENILEIENFRHPCLKKKEFVPNSVRMDSKTRTIFLTGPNMGGKSTLMRSVCLNIVMAQIGVFVPASYMRLSLIDKIYTKMQSFDSLVEGKSTFFVEMEQTLNAVRGATKNSFIVFDELGRGTSTTDGVAIAYSILNYVIFEIKCKTLFATHFHGIISSFKHSSEVQFVFMDHEVNEAERKILFKYKLKPGVCENSQGIITAKLVGIPESVLACAKQKQIEYTNASNVNFYFYRKLAELDCEIFPIKKETI